MAETEKIFKAPPEPKAAEEVREFEEKFLPDREAGLSETREQLLEAVKATSGLDSETFDEMANSFDFKKGNDDRNSLFSFKVRGHELSGNMYDTFIWLDGKGLDLPQSKLLRGKYGRVISELIDLNSKTIEKTHESVVVEALLK